MLNWKKEKALKLQEMGNYKLLYLGKRTYTIGEGNLLCKGFYFNYWSQSRSSNSWGIGGSRVSEIVS